MKEDLNHVLLTLTERECGIIKMRYGLDDGEEKTLEEVGRAFNVSPRCQLASCCRRRSSTCLLEGSLCCRRGAGGLSTCLLGRSALHGRDKHRVLGPLHGQQSSRTPPTATWAAV